MKMNFQSPSKLLLTASSPNLLDIFQDECKSHCPFMQGTFQEFIKTNERVLVEFYAFLAKQSEIVP